MRWRTWVLMVTWLAAMMAAGSGLRAEDDLLLHYAFDEGSGQTVRDQSANGLHGSVRAEWGDSPSGHAIWFDGTRQGTVSVQIPDKLRFGTDSWTFSAWLKPHQFTIDSRQNQRRMFNYGVFPDANLVIDLFGNGSPGYYFCYRDQDGKTVSTGGSSPISLALDQWSHVVVVCDRQQGLVTMYVNGYGQSEVRIPESFTGDFSLGGQLTLGSSWQNYWGWMDQVRIYRRALTRAQVREQFTALQDTFGAVVSPEALAAARRQELIERFGQTHEAWAEGRFAEVRAVCADVVASADAPGALQSYAHLRIAQSHMAEQQLRLARSEYATIAANEHYPDVHRQEAAQLVQEIDRRSRGLPARDPAASRTPIPQIDRFAAELYVSTAGDDAHDGTRARPVASLARARDLVRQWKQAGGEGSIAVNVLPGEYRVTEPLELTPQDSGSPDAPVVYRATEPGQAVFYGGTRIRGFQPVKDAAILRRLPEEARGKVLQCDLRAQGIEDFGRLAVRGFGQPAAPPTLELFVDGQPMTLARWPNEGFVGIGELVEPGSRADGKPSVFEYLDDRHERWIDAADPWLFGYFRFLWADATIQVSRIDPETRTVICDQAYHYSRPGMDTRQGIRYYAFNLLEEIDQPGEWYLDRETGMLYIYPPTDLEHAEVEIGMLSTPMLTMDQVTDVRLEGLTFDLGRFHGLILTDCQRCLILGCTVSRLAGNGITIQGGQQNGLFGCDIHTIGRRASEVIGGNRTTLTPGRHFVENCRIHNFGRIDRTYTPAVQLEGVGNRVAHNLMYNCPSSVMRIEGNDHVIEFNEVHSAVLESDDQGAMELFANPSYRGVVFRHNRFTNCGKAGAGAMAHGQAAIRFDDAISGMLVYGNIFIRSANGNFGAIQMNSGRDNIMDNNLFIDCGRGVSGGWNPNNSVWRRIAENQQPANYYTTDLYLQRYPKIATMMDVPGINHVWRNVFYRCGPMVTGNRANLDLMENGIFEDTDPGFVDAQSGDYRLQPDAPLFHSVGFRPIPLDQIGLYAHPHRASWPVETTPVPVPDWRTASER
ncbi:MAG: hypothetical protein EA424_23160 [Planctomycetaceae bacterium]|nr:MAG: hypothetical protein EA424_23160 [Planctomycetaceae bacterium]